jgi:TCP-1/cpn60 chaperonin family
MSCQRTLVGSTAAADTPAVLCSADQELRRPQTRRVIPQMRCSRVQTSEVWSLADLRWFVPLQVADIEKAEREKMADKCKRIIGHGINCFVNRQLIYNFPEQIFADAGVMAIEHADFDGIERLALVTGKPSLVHPHNGSICRLHLMATRNTCKEEVDIAGVILIFLHRIAGAEVSCAAIPASDCSEAAESFISCPFSCLVVFVRNNLKRQNTAGSDAFNAWLG